MPGGRPSKYNETIIPKTLDYLENYESYGDVMPSIAGLATRIKVARETIHAWRKDEEKSEFSHILDDLLATQEQVLFNKGLLGTFNPTIVKLALGKHGYTEKVETEHKGNLSVTDMTEDQLNAKLEALLDASKG